MRTSAPGEGPAGGTLPPVVFVYGTASDASEASRIARALVAERLAACANFFPIRSVYRWQGRVEETDEVGVIMKTTRDRFDALAAAWHERHSYEVPALVAISVEDGLPAYLAWVVASCAEER